MLRVQRAYRYFNFLELCLFLYFSHAFVTLYTVLWLKSLIWKKWSKRTKNMWEETRLHKRGGVEERNFTDASRIQSLPSLAFEVPALSHYVFPSHLFPPKNQTCAHTHTHTHVYIHTLPKIHTHHLYNMLSSFLMWWSGSDSRSALPVFSLCSAPLIHSIYLLFIKKNRAGLQPYTCRVAVEIHSLLLSKRLSIIYAVQQHTKCLNNSPSK